MRQYRGKRVDNGEWVYGWYVEHALEFWESLDGLEQFTGERPCHEIMVDGCLHEVIPETVGQSTGAKDGNGTKIYDGDILYFHPDPTKNAYRRYLRTVEWNDYLMQWQAKFPDGSGDFLTTGVCEKYEVIGTIHDKEAK